MTTGDLDVKACAYCGTPVTDAGRDAVTREWHDTSQCREYVKAALTATKRLLAASAEALRVEREAHAALSEKHNTWCRTADGKALQEAYEEGLATDSAALEREQARVRELTADNERLRAALKAATETFSEVTHVDGLPHDARVVALRGWQESARAELAPTPTGGTEHE